MQSSSLASLIDNLVLAIELDAAALRERYLLRQTLHALVRQAKAEQVLSMRMDVRRMAGLVDEAGAAAGEAALAPDRAA